MFLIAIGAIVGILVPAGPGWDFANFYDTGMRAAAGQIADIYDPKTLINGEKPQGNLDFWGTPISAYLYVPMSWLPPTRALLAFKIENTLAYFIALFLLFRHMRQFAPEDPENRNLYAAQFASAALLFQPFWTVYRVGGQTSPTVFLLLTLALIAHYKGRFKWSALCFITTVMIKPAFATGLGFLMLVSGMQFFTLACILLGLFGLFSIALIGWPLHLEFLLKMLGHSAFIAPWYYNSSLYILVEQPKIWLETHDPLTNLLPAFKILIPTVKLAFLSGFVWLVLKSRPSLVSGPAKNHFRFNLALLFFLMISQTLWEHYLALLFIPLSFILAAKNRFNDEARAIVWTIIFLSIGQNLIFIHWLQSIFTFQSLPAQIAICVFKTAPLWMTLVFLWRHHRSLFEAYSVPTAKFVRDVAG
ncbi:MAG: glycosyltransferase 87 family protein [Methylococcales bacterium]